MYEEDFEEITEEMPKKKKKKDKKDKKERKVRVRPTPNIIKIESKRIGYKAWFTNKLDVDKRIKAHHFDQIKLFMKGLGLCSYEPVSKYENGLKAYFGE